MPMYDRRRSRIWRRRWRNPPKYAKAWVVVLLEGKSLFPFFSGREGPTMMHLLRSWDCLLLLPRPISAFLPAFFGFCWESGEEQRWMLLILEIGGGQRSTMFFGACGRMDGLGRDTHAGFSTNVLKRKEVVEGKKSCSESKKRNIFALEKARDPSPVLPHNKMDKWTYLRTKEEG